MTREETSRGEGRRFVRLPFASTVQYRYGAQDTGSATLLNVGRGGVCVRLGRYLRPGTRALVQVPSVQMDGRSVELKAELVWCRPASEQHEFDAGFRIVFDEPDAIAGASELIHRALLDAGAEPRRVNERMVWSLARVRAPQGGRESRSVESPVSAYDEDPEGVALAATA
ncbi:MAG: PilZ domain-containing protein [Candidatus Hydrogenedentales bacterium]